MKRKSLRTLMIASAMVLPLMFSACGSSGGSGSGGQNASNASSEGISSVADNTDTASKGESAASDATTEAESAASDAASKAESTASDTASKAESTASDTASEAESAGGVSTSFVTQEMPEVGITMQFPEWMNDLKGSFIENPCGEVDDVYVHDFYYVPVSMEVLEQYSEDKEKLSDEEIRLIDEDTRVLEIAGIRGGKSPEETYLAEGSEEEYDSFTIQEIGSFEDMKWYFVYSKADLDIADPALQEEYIRVRDALTEQLKSAEYYQPVEKVDPALGQILSFETTDLDGNKVTSEEIFSKNEITLVNIWGTYCGPCKEELPELNETNKRLAEKNCGIIGITWDTMGPDDSETIAEAKEILKDAGVEYMVLVTTDELRSMFDLEGVPTTYFVDKSGKILDSQLGAPDMDERPNPYETKTESLLKGEESSSDSKVPTASDNNEGKYRVIVTSETGEPIPGVTIQFCDANTCKFGKTDDKGMISFEEPEEKKYDVHVLKAPDGWEGTDRTFTTAENYSDVYITLDKK